MLSHVPRDTDYDEGRPDTKETILVGENTKSKDSDSLRDIE